MGSSVAAWSCLLLRRGASLHNSRCLQADCLHPPWLRKHLKLVVGQRHPARRPGLHGLQGPEQLLQRGTGNEERLEGIFLAGCGAARAGAVLQRRMAIPLASSGGSSSPVLFASISSSLPGESSDGPGCAIAVCATGSVDRGGLQAAGSSGGASVYASG